jgi:hypothetical protein
MRMRWAGHIAHMGERRGAYRVLVGKSEGRRPLGRIILRWISGRGRGAWPGSIWPRVGTDGRHL